MKPWPQLLLKIVAATVVLAVVACSSPAVSQVEPVFPTPEAIGVIEAVAVETSTIPIPKSPKPLLLLNQHLVESYADDALDPEDINGMFWAVFSNLPNEVIVYPTENYFYFKIFTGGQEFWGNIRLPAGDRDDGVLAFGYFEYNDVPPPPGTRFSRFKTFNADDALTVERLDRFRYQVEYRGKSVLFNLFQIEQKPPELFALGSDEVFVQRTFDESGFQFFLLFNQRANYFFWVLNEEVIVPDILDSRGENVLLGRRSRFAFWVDQDHGDRKILTAISTVNVSRNNYFDGPFDQLADNYAEEVQIAKFMKLANPSLDGRIDQYGYFNDTERPLRVSLSHYYRFTSTKDLDSFTSRIKDAEDPYRFISRRGVP